MCMLAHAHQSPAACAAQTSRPKDKAVTFQTWEFSFLKRSNRFQKMATGYAMELQKFESFKEDENFQTGLAWLGGRTVCSFSSFLKGPRHVRYRVACALPISHSTEAVIDKRAGLCGDARLGEEPFAVDAVDAGLGIRGRARTPVRAWNNPQGKETMAVSLEV